MVHRLSYLVISTLLCAYMCAGEVKQLCDFVDVSEPVASIMCSVETGKWVLSKKSTAIVNAGCLLGAKRCNSVMHVPTESEVQPSPPPPDAKNRQYQELAMKAEAVVPTTWWRKGFANDAFLLSHNDAELPRKQFDATPYSNKRLKNIVQCVTKQQFIRKSFDFDGPMDTVPKCTSMNEVVVTAFLDLWKKENGNMGGEWVSSEGNVHSVWYSRQSDEGKLLISALDVIDHFLKNYGGIWTGCQRLDNAAGCRGALAAASLVVATSTIADFAGRQKTFTESQFTRGYLFATLGRGLLHGDLATTGNTGITQWGVRCADFVGLQGAYQKLYIDSFGAMYKEQLDKYIPMSFPPSFEVHSKQQWRHLAQSFEPVYTSLRNWMFTEVGSLIDFGPYRPLVAFQEVREQILSKPKRRRVLIDVGANGFFASPKYLLDSYAPYLPFTHAVMIEPEPHFSASVPKVYSDRYNISFLQIYAEVATGSETDMLVLLPKLVTKDDFVVLKFDVDPNRYAQGPTMEWGFLFSIMGRPEIAQLVDEIYIELHFHFPSLYWSHYHSNWEALDAIRYLRSKGTIVHAWP